MIPYMEDFYSQQEANEFFEFIKAQPFVRPPNPRNKTCRLRRLSFPGYAPFMPGSRTGRRLFKRPSNYDVSRSVAEAPELYRIFAARLGKYAGREINYLSTMGYLTDDHMDFHQHDEDKGREDQSVWVLSLGAVHPVAIRPKGCKDKSQWEIIHPAHGSLYVLPSSYNLTHEHAVLDGTDYSYGGLRIAINTKHIPVPVPDEKLIEEWLQTNSGTMWQVALGCPGLVIRDPVHVNSILEKLVSEGRVVSTKSDSAPDKSYSTPSSRLKILS